MTRYAGEHYIIHATPKTDDKPPQAVPIADIQGLAMSIWAPDDTAIQTDQPMTYNSDTGRYEYGWNTTGLAHGVYKAKVVITGTDGRTNWEWKTIRLAPAPVAAAL